MRKRNFTALIAASAMLSAAALLAADITINTATTYNSAQKFDNVYANADVTVGDTKATTVTVNAGKTVYLPGKEGASSTFFVNLGSVAMGNASSGFKIGYYPGYGYINVGDCKNDVNLGRVEVYDGAQVGASGYVDLRLSNGHTSNGKNWNRLFFTSVYNYRQATSAPLRLLLNDLGTAIAPWAYSDSALFCVTNEGAKTIIEGVGQDICFVNSSWWTSPKTISLMSASASKGILRTQGDCNVIFHNTHNASETMTKPAYTFQLNNSTNQMEWAHTGMTVISNACVLSTTVDYALPHGSQTGPLCFSGASSYGSPWLDLCGTTQIVNGVRNTLSPRTYKNVTSLRSEILNSAARKSLLIVRNEKDDDFIVGYLMDKIDLRKEGAGSLAVQKIHFSSNNIDVAQGSIVISSLYSAEALGDVVVADGATLVLDGVTISFKSLATLGSGMVVCRNTAKITGIDLKDINLEIVPKPHTYSITDSGKTTTYTAQTAYEELNGESTCTGAFSLFKSGSDLLTYSSKGVSFNKVCVSEGALRIGGELSTNKYWRYSFTKATTTTATWTLKFYNTSTKKYSVSTTFTPWFNLGRLHMFGSDPSSRVNSTISYAGKDIAIKSLAAGKVTDNAFGLKAYGLGGSGYLDYANALANPFTSWYTGSAWTNTTPISVTSPMTVTFRLQESMNPASGYLMSELANSDLLCRPQSWTVESSGDGVTWTVMDERYDTEAVADDPKVYGNGTVPFLFSKFADNWYFQPTGAVTVASGASLDLSPIPQSNIEICELGVDVVKKGGTITNAVLTANGYIDLENVTEGSVEHLTDLGLTFVDSLGIDNVEQWRVRVNGKYSPSYYAQILNNRLYVRKVQRSVIVFH